MKKTKEERKAERTRRFFKVFDFLANYGTKIVFGIGGVLLVTAGVKAIKREAEMKAEGFEILKKLEESLKLGATSELLEEHIDELIFTDLAQAIEESVLDRGLEKVTIERSYDLGDFLHKFVTVDIENVYGD